MSHTPAPHRTWVEIDLTALRHNAGVARHLAGLCLAGFCLVGLCLMGQGGQKTNMPARNSSSCTPSSRMR